MLLTTAAIAIVAMVVRTLDVAAVWPELGPPSTWFVQSASAEVRSLGQNGQNKAAGTVQTASVTDGAKAIARFEATDPAAYGVLEDVASQLKDREQDLTRREAALAARETAVRAVEDRASDQLKRLEAFKTELSSLAQTIKDQESDQARRLVRVYESMKPANAAEVFNGLEPEVLISIARAMNGQKLARIVAEMDPAKAQDLTVVLARPKEMPTLQR